MVKWTMQISEREMRVMHLGLHGLIQYTMFGRGSVWNYYQRGDRIAIFKKFVKAIEEV